MEIVSFILTVLGFVISGLAYFKSESAKQAVDKLISRRNAHDDLDRLRLLIAQLEGAKASVSPWVQGMSQERRQGRSQADDLQKLSETVDFLRTKAPIDLDAKLSARIRKSASILDREFGAIVTPTDNHDHWKAALSEIQLIIPVLEQAERKRRDAQVLS
jgi:hypothetical protein